MRLLILLFFVTAFSNLSIAQVAVSYFPFHSVFSVSSDTENRLWGDLQIGSNTFFTNITTEGSILFNWKSSSLANFYSGIGVRVDPFYKQKEVAFINGYSFITGVRVKPIQRHKNLQIVFELSPYVNAHLDGGLLRSRLGISYNLHSY